MIYSGRFSEGTKKMPFDFVKAHYAEILTKIPEGVFGYAGELPRVGLVFCDASSKQELKEFFGPRVDKLPGGRHTLDQTLESIDVCIALKAARQAEVEAFFSRY